MKLVIAMLAALLCAPVIACDHLVVEDAWIREAPPGAPTRAGYASLRNDGNTPLRLDGVSSSDFDSAEIHSSRTVDGQMRMRRIDPLILAPGQLVRLAPGGDHLMLLGAKPSLTGSGSTIEWRCGGHTSRTLFPIRKTD